MVLPKRSSLSVLRLPQVVQSFEPKYFASVLGLPQIVVPSTSTNFLSSLFIFRIFSLIWLDSLVAQLPYESRVSKRTEYIPVITTFAGPKGEPATSKHIDLL